MKLLAAISSDVDTLASIYQGHGCRRPGGYTFTEFRIGLENFARFLEPYKIHSTLFMVGNDLAFEANQSIAKAMVGAGHEIGNHTMTHAQGFRLLPPAEKEAEIAGMEDICLLSTGKRPVGFRSPGWNMGDDAISILKRRGYLYDSSIHPTSLAPLLKFLHWTSTSSRHGGDRTTMGHFYYFLAPRLPYISRTTHLGQRGTNGIIEIPLTVLPVIRLPFWATFLVATGFTMFQASYKILKNLGIPIQYQFHLSDFVDYNHPDLIDQVPKEGDGVYIPQALRAPLEKKIDLFRRALDMIANDYHFIRLDEWANQIDQSQKLSNS